MTCAIEWSASRIVSGTATVLGFIPITLMMVLWARCWNTQMKT